MVPIDNFGPFEINNTALAFTPFGTSLSDQSTDGLNPDPNHNGNPTEEGENTVSILSLDERPSGGPFNGSSTRAG